MQTGIPPRSQLYHLEPIGIGSPLVESLSSYLTRLAHAHLLTVSSMVRYIISPLLTNSYFSINSTTMNSYKAAGSMNGHDKTAMKWVNALQILTMRTDLIHTTLLQFKEFIPDKGLIHQERLWCSKCLSEWRENNTTIYEPLLWKIEEVVACPIHKIMLSRICFKCRNSSIHIKADIYPGYCPTCGSWLGYDGGFVTEATEDKLWKARAVSDLLACTPQLLSSPNREAIMNLFDHLINNRTKRSAHGLGRLVHINHAYIVDWHNGKYLPKLGTLLHICRFFNISLKDVVFQTLNSKCINSTIRQEDIQNLERIICKNHEIDWNGVKKDLLTCDETQLIRLGVYDIAKKRNCSPSGIYRKFPELCDYYSANRNRLLRRLSEECREKLKNEIRLIIETLISDGEPVMKSKIYNKIGGRGATKVELIQEVLRELNL